MKILVTGATGFLGSAITRLLLTDGHELKVLVRETSNRQNLEGLDLEVVIGDLGDISSLRRALKGCASLYHVAADYRLWTPEPEELYTTNVDGTRNLMRAAGEVGLTRIVYTSSVAVLGLTKDGTSSTEEEPVHLSDMTGHYKRSKFLAEELVRTMYVDEGLPIVIVNPSMPVGARDLKPTPSGRIIVDFINGRMPAYVDTGLNLVHVDDCALGHRLAFEKGRVGERYILGGENHSLKSILRILSNLSGRRVPRLRLPHQVLFPFAFGSEAWSRISGSETRLTRDALRMAQKKMFFSSEKAKKELNFSSRSAEEALSDAVTWFSDNNYFRMPIDKR